MKLPKFTASGPVNLPRFQAVQAPAPRLITNRNERYIPTKDPGKELAVAQGAIRVDALQSQRTQREIIAFAKIVDTAQTAVADAQFAEMQADYLKSIVDEKIDITTNTPLSIKDVNGVTTYPYKQATERLGEFSESQATRITSGRLPRANQKFAVWRQQIDASNYASMQEWELKRHIDQTDADYDTAMETYVQARNEPELTKKYLEKKALPYFVPAQVDAEHRANLEAIRVGRVLDKIVETKTNLNGLTANMVHARQEEMLINVTQVSDPKTQNTLVTAILGLDELQRTDQDRNQLEATNRALVHSYSMPPDQRRDFLNNTSQDPRAENVFGVDGALVIAKAADAAMDPLYESDPRTLARLRAELYTAMDTGIGFNSVLLELTKAEGDRKVSPGDAADLGGKVLKAKQDNLAGLLKAGYTSILRQAGVFEGTGGGLSFLDSAEALTTRQIQEIDRVREVWRSKLFEVSNSGVNVRAWARSEEGLSFVNALAAEALGVNNEEAPAVYQIKGATENFDADDTGYLSKKAATMALRPAKSDFDDFMVSHEDKPLGRRSWVLYSNPHVALPNGGYVLPDGETYTDDGARVQ